MTKIGIFGGTFNPFHSGHKKCIEQADRKLDFDKILVIPDKLPPHKEAVDLASDADRLNMCALGISDIKKAEVCDIELKSEGKSYTVYTLRKLKEIYPDSKLYFIMGSDMLLTFDEWYKYEEILSLCTVVCMARKDEDKKLLAPYAEKFKKLGEVIIISAEPLEVSSTDIRQMIREGKDLSCFLDKSVVEYIIKNGVYK